MALHSGTRRRGHRVFRPIRLKVNWSTTRLLLLQLLIWQNADVNHVTLPAFVVHYSKFEVSVKRSRPWSVCVCVVRLGYWCRHFLQIQCQFTCVEKRLVIKLLRLEWRDEALGLHNSCVFCCRQLSLQRRTRLQRQSAGMWLCQSLPVSDFSQFLQLAN